MLRHVPLDWNNLTNFLRKHHNDLFVKKAKSRILNAEAREGRKHKELWVVRC
jgi:hypothetical protein